jgi:hypothetical protein
MIAGVFGLTVLDEEDFWSNARLVVAIAATVTVVVFVVRTVGWAETTRWLVPTPSPMVVNLADGWLLIPRKFWAQQRATLVRVRAY